MGIYTDQILPRVIDKVMATDELAEWRRRTTAGLAGTVVEIGFGSGLNVPAYPPGIELVYAVDPSLVGRSLAHDRVEASPVPIHYVGLDGQHLPLDDASCDGALSTFTLCTVPDPAAALAELARVLVPDGRLHVCEHGRAPDARVARCQERLDPVQRFVAGGCNLSRDVPALVEAAGFDIVDLEASYAGGPRAWSWFTRLVARAPGSARASESDGHSTPERRSISSAEG